MTAAAWRLVPRYEPIEAESPTRAVDRLQRVKDTFAVADGLKILFVGETIIDEYRYVRSLQKSAKEYVIATVEIDHVTFAGGIVAAAKHAEWKDADHLTAWKNIRKTRFVDADFKRKLFEVYSTDRLELDPYERDIFRANLRAEVAEADVVIVLDFGHGLLGEAERTILESAQFLAVNAQTNAGNYGFNPITKYHQADFICIDEPEARIAVRNNVDDVRRVVAEVQSAVDCPKFLVTRGRNGLCYGDWIADRNGVTLGEFGFLNAYAAGGVDTMGAGDAVMAVTAPLLAAGLDLATAAVVGNAAGAIKVGIVGHERHIGRAELLAKVEECL